MIYCSLPDGNYCHLKVLDEFLLGFPKIINVKMPYVIGDEFYEPPVELLYFFNKIFQLTCSICP